MWLRGVARRAGAATVRTNTAPLLPLLRLAAAAARLRLHR
jgi:hypothetical protein